MVTGEDIYLKLYFSKINVGLHKLINRHSKILRDISSRQGLFGVVAYYILITEKQTMASTRYPDIYFFKCSKIPGDEFLTLSEDLF